VQLYELFSELGFIRVVAICYDFLYSPLPPRGRHLLHDEDSCGRDVG